MIVEIRASSCLYIHQINSSPKGQGFSGHSPENPNAGGGKGEPAGFTLFNLHLI
jgi:hypothetical protein